MTTINLPLMIDVHSHADRGPLQHHKGTLETETSSALVSGFGTILIMPNCKPELLTYSEVLRARSEAKGRVYCNVGYHFGTRGQNMKEFSKVWGLVHGLKIYFDPTTGGMNIPLEAAEKAVAAWDTGLPILVHSEGAELTAQVIGLAEKYRRRIHICHVNLAEQVEVIRKAKYNGVGITAEVCPHHLIFTASDQTRLGGYGIMKPPLSSEDDVEALWSALQDGTIDIIATDHAPHSKEEKKHDKPAFGVISEPTFSVLWTHFQMRGLPIELLTKVTVLRPSQIFGVAMSTGTSMDVDLNDSFTLEPEMIQSTAHSPYTGMQLWGRIRQIQLNGRLVYQNGIILSREGKVI